MNPSDERRLDQNLGRAISSFFALEGDPDRAMDSVSDADHEIEYAIPTRVGPYEILDVIARGGVGLVLRARDPELGREVAVKVIRPEHANDPEMQARFTEEARLTSRLQHPGIVPIYEVGHDVERAFFTMKVIDGEDFARLLERRQTPDQERRRYLNIFEAICETVAYAHDKGVVHQDLKPGNVMVGAFGEVQVVDWGFARDSGAPGRDESSALRILGTPAYMAPEQARGNTAELDARTDVFALGAVLCEILTGSPPYVAASRREIFLKATRAWLDDARGRLAECGADPELVELAQQCLHEDPQCRPQDASVVARGVQDYFVRVEEQQHALELEAAESRARAGAERRARRLTLLLSCLAVIAVLAVAFGIWREGREEATRLRTERAVVRALDRATLLRDQAQSSDATDPTLWKQALIAAQQAETVVSGTDIDPALADRVQSVLAATKTDHGRAVRNHRFLIWLDDPRLRAHIDARHAGLEIRFFRSFRRLGYDLASADVGQRIRASDVRAVALRALDELVGYMRRVKKDESSWVKFVNIAIAADPDARANEVRAAYRDDDLASLQRLATTKDLEGFTANSLIMLAHGLGLLGEPDAAIRLTKSALDTYPTNYQIVHSLEARISAAEPTNHERIQALSRLGVSLRPKSPHAWYHLACAYLRTDDFERAQAAYSRGSSLAPDLLRPGLVRGARNLSEGFALEASKQFAKALSAGACNRLARVHLAELMYRLQDASAAEQVYGSLHSRTTHEAVMLGLAQAMQGRFREALASMKQARADAIARGVQWSAWGQSRIESVMRAGREARRLSRNGMRAASKNPADRAHMATVALLSDRPVLAVRLFESAFAEQPDLVQARSFSIFGASFRVFAARAAIRVATDSKGEATKLSDSARAKWRQRALDWLVHEVEALEKVAGGRGDRKALRMSLAGLLHAPAFAPVRVGDGLDRTVPRAERPAWRAFWKGVVERYR